MKGRTKLMLSNLSSSEEENSMFKSKLQQKEKDGCTLYQLKRLDLGAVELNRQHLSPLLYCHHLICITFNRVNREIPTERLKISNGLNKFESIQTAYLSTTEDGPRLWCNLL